MKKILLLVSTMFILVTSYLLVDYYKNKEVSGIVEDNSKYSISISKVENQKKTLDTLKETADKYEVNVQKIVYRLQEDSTFLLDIYTEINQEDKILDNIIIDGEKLSKNSNINAYMSSINDYDDNLIGVFSILDTQNTYHIRPFLGLEKENLEGVYTFSGVRDNLMFENLKMELVNKGIRINEGYASSASSLVTSKVVTFLPVLFLLVILTCIYYYIMKFKEFSVMLLNGYSIKDIVKEESLFFCLLNGGTTAILMILFMIIHYVQYQVFNYYLYGFVFGCLSGIAIVITLVECLCAFLLTRVKITLCLKNERPNKEINIISVITKLSFCVVFLFTGMTSFMSIKSLESTNRNIDDWKSTINFAYPQISFFSHTENGNTYEVGVKCQKLFKLFNDKDALMIRPDGYFSQSKSEKDTYLEMQDLYYSDFIEVNNNYLKKYPVYDKSGKQLLYTEDENILTVLVPKKYEKDLQKIKEMYSDYPDLRYLDENLFNETNGLPQITTKQKMRFAVYENKQKFFTYDPNMNKEEQNYIDSPIIMVTNPNNRGTDIYYSMMTKGEMIVPIHNPENPFLELEPMIKEAGASDLTSSAPTVFSRVDQKQYELKKTLMEYGLITIASIIGYILMTIFVSLNHVESSKRVKAVQTILGYSYINRHFAYYVLNILPYMILAMFFGIITKEIMLGLYLAGIIFIIDIVITTLVVYTSENKSVHTVLKGE